MIYLDYSANTPADPRVAEAFLRASLDFPGNPNSKHPAGQAAANALSESRNRIAELLSVLPEEPPSLGKARELTRTGPGSHTTEPVTTG